MPSTATHSSAWRPVTRAILTATLAAGGLGLALSAYFAFQFTGPQRREVRPLPADFSYAVENVAFSATDGVMLRGWLVPAPAARRAVVLLHGNGSTRSQMLARARWLRSLGWTVLLYDARGHGQSAGDLVSVGLLEARDLRGALQFLRASGITEIGCLGASQGGATIALAAPLPAEVRWVVLESVYPDITTALDRRFRRTLHLPGWLAGVLLLPVAEWRLGVAARDIAPVRAVSRMECRVLVLGGERDEHTTSEDTRALFDAVQAPKELWLVPGTAHVDLYGAAGVEYERRLLAFITAH